MTVTPEGGESVELGPGTLRIYQRTRCTGKSIAHLIGRPLLNFADWTRASGLAERKPDVYVCLAYDRYKADWAIANPPGLQDLGSTVDPSQQKGTE